MEDTLKHVGGWFAIAGLLFLWIFRVIGLPNLEWVGLVLGGIALAMLGCSEIIRNRENSKLPVRTVNATFVRQRRIRIRRRYRIWAYYLTFQLEENDARLEFEVPFTEYDTYDPTTAGVLTYQGWRFISFRRGVVPAVAPIKMEVTEPIVMQELVHETQQKPDGILTHELDE